MVHPKLRPPVGRSRPILVRSSSPQITWVKTRAILPEGTCEHLAPAVRPAIRIVGVGEKIAERADQRSVPSFHLSSSCVNTAPHGR